MGDHEVVHPQPVVDQILRNTIRYTISADEYRTLQEYLIKRTPPAVSRWAPSPSKYNAAIKKNDDYNAAAIRASLRVFVAAQTGLNLWDLIAAQFFRRAKPSRTKAHPSSLLQSPNFRLSISVSAILLLHRVFHRFFTRLRANILTNDARPFRKRNPWVSKILTARLAPAIGASLAGFTLGLYPGDQLRITLAIWIATRAAECAFNAVENEGWFPGMPWWFGSWMLQPPVFGQLLHSFLFDRECFPNSYGDFILRNTPNYVQRRPVNYPRNLPWPSNDDLIDGFATISRLNYPSFTSPILFPSSKDTLHPTLTRISPVTSSAHPSIRQLSCALLHPNDPSCLRTYMTFYLHTFPQLAKLFTLIFTLMAFTRYTAFLLEPTTQINKLAKRILRTTLFVSGAIGTSWGSICLFQYILPRTFLTTQRWFWGGFLGGLWAIVDRQGGRARFMYSTRLSIDSLWKVGIKRGWWQTGRNGDVWVFVAGLMLLNSVYELQPAAVDDGIVRRCLGMLRGEGWVDRAEARKMKGN